MNYMKNQDLKLNLNNSKQTDQALRLLAGHVGDFIRYWGFRRIHGEIWSLVYLSGTPLSGVEIVNKLKVSKALVSPALKELEDEGLIEKVPSENSKVKRYIAVEDVASVIKGVLNRREKPMLEKIAKAHQALSKSNLLGSGYREDRLEQIGAMIQTAQMGLGLLLEFDEREAKS